jgi:hypothetical protein
MLLTSVKEKLIDSKSEHNDILILERRDVLSRQY